MAKKMQDVIVSWSQAPDPEALVGIKSTLGHYHAGECPNCRCYPAPVLTFDDINFPAHVCWGGTIKTMSKQEFKKIAGGLEELAAA